jgi:hypothetical protein
MHKFEYRWISPEYEHEPKDVSWYWMSVIAAIVILAVAVWQENYLFAVFVVIAEVLILVWANREPRMVLFHLTDRELTIDGRKSYALSQVEYWSHEDPPNSEWSNLFFHMKHRFHLGFKVHVPKHELDRMKNSLSTVVPEGEREEGLLDVIDEFLGF